jgi:KaiC/GvpD/RAD55 family RecA-like ATPase
MNKTLAIELSESREKVIREIHAFASEYSHKVDGRDIVIVDQLLDFLGSHE